VVVFSYLCQLIWYAILRLKRFRGWPGFDGM